MMTPEDRVRAGGVVLLFDAANVPTGKLFKLAKTAKHCGAKLRVVVPIAAHVERLTHLRRSLKGAIYDAAQVREALEDAGVEVWPLDAEAAEAIAERLCHWFPTSDAWQDAKWKRLYGDQARGKDRHPPATVDWFTAAACPSDGIVVTGDTGGEFSMCETIEPAALERILHDLAPG